MRSINVEILLDHSTGISDSYYRPNENELLEDYLKAIPDLTISEEEKIRADSLWVKKEKVELEKTRKDLAKLKDELWDSKFELMEMIDDAIEEPTEFRKMINQLRKEKQDRYDSLDD